MAKKQKKSRAKGGQGLSADKAKGSLPPDAREPNSRAEGHVSVADEAKTEMPDARESNAAGSEGHGKHADKAIASVPASPPRFSDDPRIRTIQGMARVRGFWMDMRLRNTARVAAKIRGHIQPDRAQDEEWSNDTKALALAIVGEAVEAFQHSQKSIGKKTRARKAKLEHALLEHPYVQGMAPSLADYEAKEDAALAQMEEVFGELEICGYLEANKAQFKGFSRAGGAVLTGHAGDFRDYPKKGHLWRRLGLAPFTKDGVTRAGSTWGKLGGLSAEDWTEFGYKRSRLGDIFGKIVNPLFKAQWQSPDAGKKIPKEQRRPACAKGYYGEVFGRYKARQIELNETGAFAAEVEQQIAGAKKKKGKKPQKALLEGKLPASQINSRALRRMAQKLVSDLWSEWRRLDHGISADKANPAVSTAAKSIEGKAKVRVPHVAATDALPTPQSNEIESHGQNRRAANRGQSSDSVGSQSLHQEAAE